MKRAGESVRRHLVTLGVIVLLVLTTTISGSLGAMPASLRWTLAAGPDAFAAGHLLSPITSVLIADGGAALAVALVACFALLGTAEGLMGWWRTALLFVGTAVVGISAGAGVQTLAALAGESWAVTTGGVIDPLTPIVGTLLAASAFAEQLWRRRIRVVGFAVLLLLVLYGGSPADVNRLLAALTGLAVGPLLVRAPRRWLTVPRSSHHEARTLLAALVAMVALGPLVTLLSRSPHGPLHVLGSLFEVGASASQSACDAAIATADCVRFLALERIDGPGPVLLSILPLAVLALCALALLRGSRAAAWVATGLLAFFAYLAAFYSVLLPLAPDGGQLQGDPSNGTQYVPTALSVLVPLALGVVLLINLKHFPVRADRRSLRVFWSVTGGALGVTALAYIIVGSVTSPQFQPPVTVIALLIDLPERYVPIGFLHSRLLEFVPVGPVASALYDWVGPAFWFALLISSGFVFTLSSGRAGSTDLDRVRRLLREGGSGSLSHMATWQGNSYWFTPDERAAIAYRVNSGVAVTTGGPIGDPAARDEAVRGFAAFCDERGWIVAFYSVESELLPTLAEMGYSSSEIGDDAVLVPADFTLAGGRWKDIRTSINRAAKLGVSAEWTTWGELSLATRSQIEAISEEWVAGRNLPEMGFTLGGIDELADPDVRLMLAVADNGGVLAVTSWMPTYRDGVVIGWTLDFMRRRTDSMNGVIEFLIAETLLRSQRDGLDFVSLSAAPLARAVAPGDNPGVALQVLGYVGRRLESLYGFRSLLTFKLKFGPNFRPLWVAYPDNLALPAIGIALARAYLPSMTMPQAVSIMRSLVRPSDTQGRDGTERDESREPEKVRS